VSADDKTEADRLFSARGVVEMPIVDQPWGDYSGAFADRFGMRWMVGYTCRTA